MVKVHVWAYRVRTKALIDEGLPTTVTPHSRVQATKWMHLTVRANELWCVTNCQMNFLLQIPQREGGARLT